MALEQRSDSYSEILRREVTFSRLALALTRDYLSVYYVNMLDNSYVEYAATGDGERLNVLSEGSDFFADMVTNCRKMVHLEDQERFFTQMNKDSFNRVIRTGEAFTMDYRLMINGTPVYYKLKVTRISGTDDDFIVVGVRNIDTQKRRELATRTESEIFNQIALALASRYEVIYYVNLITNEYTEYSSSQNYAQLHNGNHGYDFFGDTQRNIMHVIYEDDRDRILLEMQKDRFVRELSKVSTYSLTYRLMLNGKPEYVNLRAVKPSGDEQHAIIAVSNIDESMKREIEYKNALQLAVSDALTGVKNKHGYLTLEQELNDMIKAGQRVEFAIVICDVNDLKKVNDLLGHTAGDDHIRSACKMICDVFKHSPVFRIGGDEFAIILRDEDYKSRITLINAIHSASMDNKKHGDVIVACGMAEYIQGTDYYVSDVFNRADNAMYQDKKTLKKPRWNNGLPQ